ncbi:MAG: TolC family protein [Bacteroidia bacterium]|nr:TolC family protein [Bacteroidia bacterium]
MRNLTSIAIILLLGFSAVAQNDTLVFNEKSFLQQAKTYAPALINSALEVEIQNEEWMESKAAFQPKLNGTFDLKNFDDKTYYNRLNGGLKIKTPAGIKLNGGYTDNSGVFLNPENNVPVQGLAFAGIEIPLGAGMFTDQERTEVKQRAIKKDAASLVNQLEVNNYLLEAGEAYWEWYGNILLLELANDALSRAQKRFNFVKQMNQIKEVADIDTLEAFINLQNRSAYTIANQIKWVKSKNYLNNFLWLPTIKNEEIAPEVDINYTAVFPDSLTKFDYINIHPIILLNNADSLLNKTELTLVREYFKPELDFEFKLQESANNVGSFDYNPAQNNYVGVNLNMPLFLRKERAKAKQLNYKGTIIQNKKTELLNKVKIAQEIHYTNTENLKRNVLLWLDASKNYKRMLEAEQLKYNLGESSLFVVNNRELKWIDSREKYIKSYIDYRISVLKYYHSLCVLPNML